jgi:asparagine synthase (glutamine-hydrolysing)
MCGILGYIGKRSFDAEAFGKALDLMANRGPDDRGLYEEPEILLGHRRLAILDLSPAGHQPMLYPSSELRAGEGRHCESTVSGVLGCSTLDTLGTDSPLLDHDRYVIVFNGEVYNFQELRGPLEEEGARFRSHSDTEVILALYAKEGPACLQRFRGMFAMAIWDRQERTLFLARDRMGIKPLYVWRFPGGIAFASEVKAIKALPGGPREVNPEAVVQYLMWGSVPEPLTIVKGVDCLPPATWAMWKDGNWRQEVYWDFPSGPPLYKTREEAIEALRPVLKEAVRLRCISDAPLGAFLSGGVDSSSVVSLMREAGQQDIRTFSISFPQTDFDEGPYALRVAEQFETLHTDVSVTEGMVRKELDGFFDAMDQPTCDGVNTYLISKFAKMGGLTVSLSGLGGDELFGGYPSFRRAVRWSERIHGVPRVLFWVASKASAFLNGRGAKVEALSLRGNAVDRLYFANRGLFMPSQVKRLLHPDLLDLLPPSSFSPFAPHALRHRCAPRHHGPGDSQVHAQPTPARLGRVRPGPRPGDPGAHGRPHPRGDRVSHRAPPHPGQGPETAVPGFSRDAVASGLHPAAQDGLHLPIRYMDEGSVAKDPGPRAVVFRAAAPGSSRRGDPVSLGKIPCGPRSLVPPLDPLCTGEGTSEVSEDKLSPEPAFNDGLYRRNA